MIIANYFEILYIGIIATMCIFKKIFSVNFKQLCKKKRVF